MRVLLVESDPVAAHGIATLFEAAGMTLDSCSTGGSALRLAEEQRYDVVLLELVLPDIGGQDVIRGLRAARLQVPVVVFASQSTLPVRMECFALGADDFVSKPFEVEELRARVQAVVRRAKGHAQATVSVGTLTLNLDEREVTVAGRRMHLTGREYEVLELLALRKGQVLTKEAFFDEVYNGAKKPTHKVLDVFICKLRKKLAAAGCRNLIDTVYNRGWALREAVSAHQIRPTVEHAAAA